MVKWKEILETKIIPSGVILVLDLIKQHGLYQKLILELNFQDVNKFEFMVSKPINTQFPKPYNKIDNMLARFNIDSYMLEKNVAAYFINRNNKWVFVDIRNTIINEEEAKELIIKTKLSI